MGLEPKSGQLFKSIRGLLITILRRGLEAQSIYVPALECGTLRQRGLECRSLLCLGRGYGWLP